MTLSDLCGQATKCEQKEIDGKEYDICVECWKPLAEKLKGMGRAGKNAKLCFFRTAERTGTARTEATAR